MLKSTKNKGFSLTFENNLTISVQFGAGNYCQRRSLAVDYAYEMKGSIIESKNAEIAIWDENNNWYKFENDTVKGWVDANEIADWIYKVAKAKDITLK